MLHFRRFRVLNRSLFHALAADATRGRRTLTARNYRWRRSFFEFCGKEELQLRMGASERDWGISFILILYVGWTSHLLALFSGDEFLFVATTGSAF